MIIVHLHGKTKGKEKKRKKGGAWGGVGGYSHSSSV